MTNDRQFVANLPFLHIQNKNRVPNSFLLYICTLYFANLLKTNHGQPKDKSVRAEKRGGDDQKSSRLKFSESEGGTAENAAEASLKKKQPQSPPTAAGGETKTVGAKFYQKKQVNADQGIHKP